MLVARAIVDLYHPDGAGLEAETYFVETFSQRKQPVEAAEVTVPAESLSDGQINLALCMVGLGLAKSYGAAKQLIESGAVSLDGERVLSLRMPVGDVCGRVLRVGKHHFRRLVLSG